MLTTHTFWWRCLVLAQALWLAPALAQSGPRPAPPGEPPPAVRDGRARLLGPFDPRQTLRLAIGLKHPHAAEEEQYIQQLVTPGAEDFHRFLTPEEYAARFAPSAADEQAVVDWAVAQGLTVTHRFANRLIVDLEAPAAVIERALGVTIRTYLAENYLYFSNQREPVLPAPLAAIVRSIGGLHNFAPMHPAGFPGVEPPRPVYRPGPVIGEGDTLRADARPGEVAPAFTNGLLDPQNIYSSYAYNYAGLQRLGLCCNPLAPGSGAGSPKESSIAIAAFGSLHKTSGQLTDLLGFQTTHPYLALNVTTVPVDGGPAPCTVTRSDPCVDDEETTLDAEWATATGNSLGSNADTAHIWVYESSGSLEDMYNAILSGNHARTVSTSFACTETVGCSGAEMDTDHGIFNAMLIQGWTLMAASGDGGATASCQQLSVTYPASDPDFIGVGGTDLALNGDGTYAAEKGWTGGASAGSCASNNGGSGGGCSAYFAVPAFQSGANGTCGAQRSIPDVALNAAAFQDFYFNGAVRGVGGTSIAAPMLAGFFAQAEAYLLYVGSVTGNRCGAGRAACTPIGPANPYLYAFGLNPNSMPHYPFYDIVSGCNSNDVTLANGLSPFCAGSGYDNVTGWGSANMLQLSWAINFHLAGDSAAPSATFSGPAPNHWYNTGQTIAWTISDASANGAAAAGVAGYTSGWDADPGDDFRQPTPGAGSAYYSGPATVLSSAGSQNFNASSGGEGCHTLHLRSWDNSGITADQTLGPLCFDDVPPLLACGSPDALWHAADVSIACTAGDAVSGLAHPADSSFSLTTSVPAGTETNHAATGSYTVLDLAGNSATAGPVTGILVDKKPPAIQIVQPAAASYSAGNTLTLDYTVTDGGSGVASSTPTMNGAGGSLSSGTSIPLANLPLGANTFAIGAADNAGNRGSASVTFTVTPRAVLSIGLSHSGSFAEGLANASYTITVGNAAAAGPVSGTVTVTETLPAGLTLASMQGNGWTCPGTAPNNCTRGDPLPPGGSYAALTVLVNVAGNAPSSLRNQATVSGGGSAAATATDPTAIVISGPGACELQGAGNVTVADLQIVINEALGGSSVFNDLNSDNAVNVVDIQIVLNAALGRGCSPGAP